MIQVYLTAAEIAHARRWANEVLASDTMHVPNYTHLAALDRYFVGYLGEVALEAQFHAHRIPYLAPRHTDGLPDEADFLVSWNGEPHYTLDVKTASKKFHRSMMMPDAQFRRHWRNLYVGARVIAPEVVELWGWAKRTQVADWPIGHPKDASVPTRHWPLAALNPMEDLWPRLK